MASYCQLLCWALRELTAAAGGSIESGSLTRDAFKVVSKLYGPLIRLEMLAVAWKHVVLCNDILDHSLDILQNHTCSCQVMSFVTTADEDSC